MVTARANRSEIVCTPVGAREPGPADGWMRCAILIEAALPVDDHANLLVESVGRTVTALLPPTVAVTLPESGQWRVEAELVAPATVRIVSDPPSAASG